MAWLLHQLGHTLQLTPQDQDLSTVNSLGGSRSGNVLGLAIDCMLQWPVNIKKSKSNRRDYVAHLFGYFFIFFLLILNKNDLNEKHVRTHRHFVNHRDAHGCTLCGETNTWIDGRTSSSLMFFCWETSGREVILCKFLSAFFLVLKRSFRFQIWFTRLYASIHHLLDFHPLYSSISKSYAWDDKTQQLWRVSNLSSHIHPISSQCLQPRCLLIHCSDFSRVLLTKGRRSPKVSTDQRLTV